MSTPSHLSNMFSNKISKTHHARIFIMFWPRGECLAYSSTNLAKPSISFPGLFQSILNITWIAPSLDCRCPSMRVHTSHWPYGYPLLMLCSWQWTRKNPWCNSRHLCCHYVGCWFPCGARTTTCASFKHVQLLSSANQHCAHQNMSKFTFPIL